RAADDVLHFGELPLTLGRVETIDDAIGGADLIATGDGSNVILGGAAGDAIATGDGTNLVLGDGGAIDWAADGDPTDIDVATSTSPAIGGADEIALGNGYNLVVGGADGDAIAGGDGFAVVLGDAGEIVSAGENTAPFGGLPITLGHIATTDPGVGGDDTIATGDGSTIVLAGTGADHVTAGSGTNVVFGDDGRIDWMLDGDPTDVDRVASTDPADGAGDTVELGSGNVLVVGGQGGDVVSGGTGAAIVLGDNGEVVAAPADSPRFGGDG